MKALMFLLVLSLPWRLLAENTEKSYEIARQHASETVDIFSAGPVQIRSTFQLHTLAGQINGTYQYDQLTSNQYREDIETSNFKESVVYKDGEVYRSRSEEFEPLPIWHLRQLMRFAHMSPLNAPFSTVTSSVVNGQNVTCYGLKRGTFLSEFSGYRACFDRDKGVLVALEWSYNTDLDRLEYSRFLRNGEKLFPGTMRWFLNGNLLAEINVTEISNAATDPKLLTPPPGAVKLANCRHFQPAQADYSSEYFDIRSDYKSGSVVIAGSVDEHGKVLKTEIQRSGGSKLDEAALKALKEVRIHPAKCDGHAIQSFFRLQIWFSPSLHPDSFESSR
jgi:TonB family protein